MANFDYKKYLAEGKLYEADNKSVLRTLIQDLEPFEYEVYADDAGVNPEDGAEMEEYIASLSDEEVSSEISKLKGINEDKLDEAMFDVVTTEKIAQAVADAFTADDELDLKYVINPRIDAGHFDLDVEAGPNTPGEDSLGQDIDNYLGEFAGGSFYIKDGVVYNAAMRNAPVANVSPEGEVEMISAEDSRAALGMKDDEPNPGMYIDDEEWEREMGRMEENKNENKTPNKMKKSELKEMIKAAMMAETSVDEAEKVDVTDDENIDVEDTENVDVDVEKDVKVDDTESEVDVDVKASMPGESEDVEEVQALLMKAQEAAKTLGDEKLTDQIGNTITYFTRSHVSRVAEVDVDADGEGVSTNIDDVAAAEIGLEESIAFPMWNKIK